MRHGNLALFKRRLLDFDSLTPYDRSRLAAWSLGYKARAGGMPLTHNLYGNTPFGDEWRNGWHLRDEELRAAVHGTRRKPPAGSIG